MATITLQSDHGYVLLVAGAVAIEVRPLRRVQPLPTALTRAVLRAQFMAAGMSVMTLRKALFGKAFKERPAVKALFEEHKKAVGGRLRCSPFGAHVLSAARHAT